MKRRVLVLSALTVSLVMGTATASLALDASSLDIVSIDDRQIELLMTLDPTEAIPADASVTGTMQVGSTVFPAQTDLSVTDDRPRTAILVLDTSGSMQGARLIAAKKAAKQFTDVLPPDVRVGVVTFNGEVDLAQVPTDDRAAVEAALQAARADGDTALYDAIAVGLSTAAGTDRPRIVVLSDGADTSSELSASKALARAKAAGVPIDIVGIDAETGHQELLRRFTGATGGQLLNAAGADGLAGAFSEASKAFGAQIGLIGEVPAQVNASGQQITATVSVDGRVSEKATRLPAQANLLAQTSSPSTAQSGPIPVAEVGGPSAPWLALVPALIVFGAVLVIGLVILNQQQRQRAAIRLRQVLRYRTSAGATSQVIAREVAEEHTRLTWLEELLAQLPWASRMQARLAAGELSLSPATWFLIRSAISLALVVVLSLLLDSVFVGIVLGVAGGWLGSWVWLRSRAGTRQKKFADELPDFLMLVASSLRAGLSFTHALDSSALEGKGEVARQMRRVLREVQVGADLDDALMECAVRMENDDLRWVVTALSIQREVGGALSGILDTAAQTIKARYELHREVRTLSAEGRLSAYVLIALPLGIFAFLFLARREYVKILWTQPLGIALLVVLATLMVIGIVWMRNVVRIKV